MQIHRALRPKIPKSEKREVETGRAEKRPLAASVGEVAVPEAAKPRIVRVHVLHRHAGTPTAHSSSEGSVAPRVCVDPYSAGRKNGRMGVEPETELLCEIARLAVSIDRAAATTEMTLAEHQSRADDDGSCSPVTERQELCRQLATLRELVAGAHYVSESPRALRAELATLLFFATTLQADARTWRAGLEKTIKDLERQRTAERRERLRLAAQHEELSRRRDTLSITVAQTAARMAQKNSGECRRTLPVFTLGDGLTVCSVSVSWPRRGFRRAQRWLVTLNCSHDDVLVRPD